MNNLNLKSQQELAHELGVTRQTLMSYFRIYGVAYIKKINKRVYFSQEQIELLLEKIGGAKIC